MSQIPSISEVLPNEYFESDYQLPVSYGDTYLIMMLRDPEWLFTYWEITPSSLEEFFLLYGKENWLQSRLAMRIYQSQASHIVELNDEATSWYFNLGKGGPPVQCDLGRLLPDKTFVVLASAKEILGPTGVSILKPAKSSQIKYSQCYAKTLAQWQQGPGFSYR